MESEAHLGSIADGLYTRQLHFQLLINNLKTGYVIIIQI